MADIFISYASEDRSRVELLAKALEKQGWSVFWDRYIPGGKTWDEVIEGELDAAKCVIVVWSKISISSKWVRAEAEEGLKRNILIPVSIESSKVPLLFRPIQAIPLIDWQEDPTHPQFEKFISDLSAVLGPSPLTIQKEIQKRAEKEIKEKEQKRIDAARKTEEERKQNEPETKHVVDEDKRFKEQENLRRISGENRKHREVQRATRKAEEALELEKRPIKKAKIEYLNAAKADINHLTENIKDKPIEVTLTRQLMLPILLISIGWAIGGVISDAISRTSDYPIYFPIKGAIGGLATVAALRQVVPDIQLKQGVFITGGWVIGWVIGFVVGWLIIGPGFGRIIGWAIAGAIGGLATVAALRQVVPDIQLKQGVFITGGWVIGWVVGWTIGEASGGNIGWHIGSAMAGAIGGGVMFQLLAHAKIR